MNFIDFALIGAVALAFLAIGGEALLSLIGG